MIFHRFVETYFVHSENHSYDVEEMENKPLHADLKLIKATLKEKLRAQAQTTKDFCEIWIIKTLLNGKMSKYKHSEMIFILFIPPSDASLWFS